jgi:hypothetical protein
MIQTLPLMPAEEPTWKEFEETSPCVGSLIEFFHHAHGRKILTTKTWARLRTLDRTLKPWGPAPDETIATAKPQALDDKHILRRDCFDSFWVRDYMTSTTTR